LRSASFKLISGLMQQFLIIRPHGLVTFAGRLTKSGNVEQLYLSARVTDEAGFLQGARDNRDAGSPNSQHLRDVLLGERKLIAAVQIGRAQQPTA